jgi:hypothetical protein
MSNKTTGTEGIMDYFDEYIFGFIYSDIEKGITERLMAKIFV